MAAVRAVGVLVVLLLVSGCTGASPAPAGSGTNTAAEPPTVDAFQVGVGDCVDATTGSGEVTAVPVVPCDTPHRGEAYAALTMADDVRAFPGQDAVVEAARGCEGAFLDFVGVPLAGSQLQVTYFHPTEQSWATGDREILCVVSDPSGPVTGSLRGARR